MAAAMSVIAIPEMRKRGYPDWLSGGLVATAGGIAILIPPSIPLLIYGLVTETSVVRLFFAGVIPGLMLALGNIITVIIIAMYLKLPRGEGSTAGASARVEGRGCRRSACRSSSSAASTGGCSPRPKPRPPRAATRSCLRIHHRAGEFLIRQLLPTAMRALNLTGVILFLIGSVGVFQFLAANMYWPQKITETIVSWGLTPLGFIFAYMGVLLILGMFVDGVAMILLTVPVMFPVAFALKIDPVALGIMITLNVEMGGGHAAGRA